jgi:hypothetical protein
MYTVENIFNYSNFWYTVSAIGLATMVFFYALFREQLVQRESQ